MSVWMKALGLSIVCCFAVTLAARSQPPASTNPKAGQPGTAAQPGTAGQKAGQPGTAAQPGQQNSPQFDAERFIKDHDKNKDGKLSKDELPKRLQAEFAQIDTNKDGFIEKNELQQHANLIMHRRPELVEIVLFSVDVEEPLSLKELQAAYDELRKIDTNHDGKIEQSELKTFRDARRKERIDEIFTELDKNKDGKLSKDEVRGNLADHFNQIDTNKDGFIEKNEFEAYVLMQHPNHNNKAPGQPNQPGQPNKNPGQPK